MVLFLVLLLWLAVLICDLEREKKARYESNIVLSIYLVPLKSLILRVRLVACMQTLIKNFL